MASSQITLTVSLVMIALFSIAIIGFAINFGIDNDSSIIITDDAEFSDSYTDMGANLSTFKSDAEGTYSSILDTTIEPGSDVAQSTGPFAITPTNIIGVAKNIIYLPYKKIFGSGKGFGIFFTALIAFLVLIFGLLIYKTLRGNP